MGWKRIILINKPEFCLACPINAHTGFGYVPLKLGNNNTLFVGEAAGEDEIKSGTPFTGGAGSWLRSMCGAAKVDLKNASLINVIGCHPPSNVFPLDNKWSHTSKIEAKAAVEYCYQQHLKPALDLANKPRIIALGNYALKALTNRNAISIWRGSPLALKGSGSAKPRVMPTLHPAYIMRQAGLFSLVIRDLTKSLELPPENYNLDPTLEDVRSFTAKKFAFDLEWDRYGNITVCGLSDRYYSAMVVPFQGDYINLLKPIFENAEELIGQNIIQADMPQFERLGWRIKAVVSDTMLKQHLIQPNYKHDLGFICSVFTNKVFWKGKGEETEDEFGDFVPSQIQWQTWDKDWAIPRQYGGYGGCASAKEAEDLYNARDTEASYQIDVPLSQKLKQYGLEYVYNNVSVPVAFICRDISSKGWKIDTSRLGIVRDGLNSDIATLETQLPEGLAPFNKEVSCNLKAPPNTYKQKIKKCKGSKKLGTKHDSVNIIFNSLDSVDCSICGARTEPGKIQLAKTIKGTKQKRIVPYNSNKQLQEYTKRLKLKVVLDSKTGNVTTGKKARSQWTTAGHSEFAILGALKQKITLRNNFAKDKLLGQERMYFNLKVHGTSEGRLASNGQRKGIDLNIQNQPKNFRLIYIPDHPDWGILDLDIVQGENMLTTWIAKDWERWERINAKGYDEHADLASKIFNCSVTKAHSSKEFWIAQGLTIEESEGKANYFDVLRQVGKKINHGRNYGMGARKQREELLTMGFDYSEKDVKEFIAIWQQLNKGTADWQRRTIAEATQKGYLINPFGRKMWFQHRDMAKALAFLPASTLADMVLRMMIAHFPSHERCKEPIFNLKLHTFMELVPLWRMCAQVHDSIVLMGPDSSHREQFERSHSIMTMPWSELDGFKFQCDAKYSMRSWGEGEKIKI